MSKLYVFYHFFYPDQVVSSVLFSELSCGLAELGWQVTAFPSNRDNAGPEGYRAVESWHEVTIRRLWRPAWRQASAKGRVLNAAWMIARWALLALQWKSPPDVILLGTDPIFSVLIAPVWKLFHPATKIVQWSFDLYPEAAYADGIVDRDSRLAHLLTWLVRWGYHACDVVVDIGTCMRRLLLQHDSTMQGTTLVPWALFEPDHPLANPTHERTEMFGEAKLALLYSGSFGRAHEYEGMLELMRHLRDSPARLALSVKGNREEALRAAVLPEDTNVRFIPPVPASRLEQRLASADIHVVSLRKEWTGAVVPSKFFGALATGRPVIFCGSRDSSLAQWIERYDVGWVLEAGGAARVAKSLRHVLSDDRHLEEMKERCFQVYQEHFSRKGTTAEWDRLLRGLVARAERRP